MTLITGAADILEVAVLLLQTIPIIGQALLFSGPFVDMGAWAIIQFWLMIRGAKGLWFTAGSVVEFIPLLDILPLRTTTLWITIYLANQKAAQETEPAPEPEFSS